MHSDSIIYGLEFSEGHAVLAQLRGGGKSWVVEEITYADDLEGLGKLKGDDVRVGVVMGDEQVLYRRLALPRAEDGQLGAMVSAQAQTILPGSGEALASGWMKLGGEGNEGGTQGVLLAAARVDGVRRCRDAAHGATGAWVDVTSGAVAIDGVCQMGGIEIGDEATALVRVSHGGTLLCLYRGKELVGAASIDFDLVAKDEGAVASWGREVAEAFEVCVEGLNFKGAEVGVLICGESDYGRLKGALGSALRCSVEKGSLSEDFNPACLPGATRAVGAIGAALGLVDMKRAGRVGLHVDPHPDDELVKVERGFRPGLFVGATVWVLLMVLGMYQFDKWQAVELERALVDAKQLTEDLGGLEGRLALLNYIEKHATTPALPLMQEVSKLVPQGTLLSDYSYDRDGRVRFSGYVSSASALDEFTAKLTASPLFKSVDVPSAKYNERSRRWDYQINALAVPLTLYSAHLGKMKKPVAIVEKSTPPEQKTAPDKKTALDKSASEKEAVGGGEDGQEKKPVEKKTGLTSGGEL